MLSAKSTLTRSLILAVTAAAFLPAYLAYYGADEIQLVDLETNFHWLSIAGLVVGNVAIALVVKGTRGQRVRKTITANYLIFGLYAIAIIAGKLFFIRAVMFSALIASLLICLAIVWLRGPWKEDRVAVVLPLMRNVPPQLGNYPVITDHWQSVEGYDAILMDLHEPITAEWSRALSRAMLSNCRIRHVYDYVEDTKGAVSVSHFELEHVPAAQGAIYLSVKRAADVATCILLSPIILFVVAVAAIFIHVSDKGAIFYVDKRVGRGGESFRMWKLRTMRTEPASSMAAAVVGDKRVTPIGRHLRRFRIDELPQLWNVLKGDMSLIGPRPESEALHWAYVSVEPKFAFRSLVRPGLSGWAQVNAPPSANAEEAIHKLSYDLYYLKKQSFWMDAEIAARTVWTIIGGRGVR
jgi:lipopolysaccharide/colanic/teichoic acid biosynthesis glycosyltransferase